MNKQEFLVQLRNRLSGLPQDDIEERLNFYSEMIDDRMEDGLSEEEAVSAIGSVDSIIEQIVADIPLARLVKEKITPKRKMKAWEMALLVLGSPIWLSLLIVAFAVVLSLYISWWAVIISLWAVYVSSIGCFIGNIVSGVVFIIDGNTLSGIAMIGLGIFCLGLAIFLFFASKTVTKGTLWITKKTALGVKTRIIKKEEA